MCGIYGIIGKTTTNEFIKKLKSLEYRGYDSCGLCYAQNGLVNIYKTIGNVDNLMELVNNTKINISIGHTRWATHGIVSNNNAHPHTTANKRFYIVHNGMIDNYKELINRYKLSLTTETDSEVIAHLLDCLIEENSMIDSIKKLVKLLEGSYAIVILDANNSNRLYFLKNKSPLLLAINKYSVSLSSDQIAFDNDSNVTILNDFNYGFIENKSYQIFTDIKNEKWNTFYKNDSYLLKKYTAHYMLDEILFQDKMILDIVNNYQHINTDVFINLLKSNDEIVFSGAGSSYYASKILALYYEKVLNKRCYAIVASELLSFNILKPNTLFILLSQSGETADLCNAMTEIKHKGMSIVALCNNVNSTIGYNSDYIFPLFARKEISVASTKAFTAMVYIGKLLINKAIIAGSIKLRQDMKKIYDRIDEIKLVALELIKSNCVFYIGKDIDYPIAQEGSLKLKEVSYIHSFAFPSGELKHGSIALVDNNTFALGIVTSKKNSNFVKNNLEEIRSRGGKAVLISNCITDSDYYIEGDEICIFIFLQLIAYYSALYLNRNIDQPRNLAKSVTVL